MRALLVSPSVMPLGLGKYGGVEGLVSVWSAALQKVGHNITVAAPEGSILPEGVALIPTVRLPEFQDRDDVTDNILHLDAYKDAFDVVHDFSHKNVLKDRAIHMVWHPVVNRYPCADNRQVCLSNWQRERFQKVYGQEARVMPMWTTMKPIENPIRERLLFFGAIIPAKGVLMAIDMAKRLGANLDVAGGLIPSELDSPYLKAVEEKCDGEKVRLHFNVSEDKKNMLIQNAKAVVYPVQQAESHWLTGMEAWSAGTPTLALNLGAMREITKPECGIVVDTTAEFEYLMNRLDKDEAFRKTFDGALEAQEAFSVENVLPKWEHLYTLVGAGLSW